MTKLKRVEEPWDLDLLRRWAADRAAGVQYTAAGKDVKVEYLTRRNYNSSWQDKYWDLMYKRGSYVNDLRELNMAQAAAISWQAHDVCMLNLFIKEQGLKETFERWREIFANPVKTLKDSKWVGDE